jgi:2'-5' RNA ligase
MFFALWPGAAQREQCIERLKTSGRWPGRPVKRDNYHITLAFLGRVTEQQHQAMVATADDIQLPVFELTLDHMGVWPRPQVLWLGGRQVAEPLQALVAALNQGMTACGLIPDRRPFYPHMTLMRKVRRGPPNIPVEPIIWPVESFVLVESETLPDGVRYLPLRQWALQK